MTRYYSMIALISSLLLCFSFFSGCLEYEMVSEKNSDALHLENDTDKSMVLPEWMDDKYHDYASTMLFLQRLQNDFPELINMFFIGESVLGRSIPCMKISNENSSERKYACVIDGGIHGNEWESTEACLYLAEFLLINFENNETITKVLNNSIIYIIPIINPDGRENNNRFNENGIDLNRNFNAHFGRIRGGSLPLGTIGGLKIPYIKRPVFIEKLGLDSLIKNRIWTNSGRKPFSEPETIAVHDFMLSIRNNLSFYVNCHTAMHTVFSVAEIDHEPEYKITDQEHKVLKKVLTWCDSNTEYDTFSTEYVIAFGAGFAHHWVFKKFHVPSFCFEILSRDYEPYMDTGKHDHLVHWMKTTLPVFMFLLVNIQDLYHWNLPSNYPRLPDGIPPKPLRESL